MNYSCEICGKEFKENGQKYRPKYQLNEHKKTCFTKFKKKQRRFIKEYSQNATDIEINRAYLFLQNPEQYINENYKPSARKTPSPLARVYCSSVEPSDDNCEYEKEYLHDTYSSSSESDRESNASPNERPQSCELSLWVDENSNLSYYIDKNENVYLPSNKALLGVRQPIQIKKQDKIIDTYKIKLI